MSPGLFVRADAGPTMGVGHFMRMLALGEEWKSRGGRVTFGGSVPPALRARAGAPFVEREPALGDADWTIAQARASGATWVAADGYSFGRDYQQRVVASGLRLLIVDDNGENHDYAANVILNVNAHAREAMYSRRPAESRLLIGSQFLLLRAAILRARLPRVARDDSLLVSFGGADPADATGLSLRAIASQPSLKGQAVVVLVGAANGRTAAYRAACRSENVRLLEDPENVADIMASSRVCICSPSTTFWEMSYLRVPCLGLIVADNQAPIAAEVQARGIMQVLGDARLIRSPHALGQAIAAALAAQGELDRMVELASGIADGKGAARVVDALLEAAP